MILMAIENKTEEYETIYCSKKCAEQAGLDLKKYRLEQLSQHEFDEINYPEDSIDKGQHWETPEGEALPLFGHCCSNLEYCTEPISF